MEVIEPLLPPKATGCGRPRTDDRKTLNGIIYVLKTGVAWEDMPCKYGAYVIYWRRLQQWSADGTWERIWRALLSMLDQRGRLDWTQTCLDGSFVPAKKGAMALAKPSREEAQRS